MTVLAEECNNKIKIAFDPGGENNLETDVWANDGGFREVCRELDLNGDNELFIITTETNTDFINNIASYLGLDSNHVWFCNDITTALTICGQQQISIYLSNQVEAEQLGNQNTDELATIFVSIINDANKLQKKYATLLQFWLNRRLKGRKSE